jgi:hypothetical protein
MTNGLRYEIVVDMSSTDRPVMLMSYEVQDGGSMFDLARTLFVGDNDEYQTFKILEVRPRGSVVQAGEAGQSSDLPAPLNVIERLRPDDAARTRVVRLTDRMSINGQPMDHSRIDAVIRQGDTAELVRCDEHLHGGGPLRAPGSR